VLKKFVTLNIIPALAFDSFADNLSGVAERRRKRTSKAYYKDIFSVGAQSINQNTSKAIVKFSFIMNHKPWGYVSCAMNDFFLIRTFL
jgi:hypothetical protein